MKTCSFWFALFALMFGGCASLSPATFPERHPIHADSEVVAPGDTVAPSPLRAYALPDPLSPLHDGGSPPHAAGQKTPMVETSPDTLYTCPMHPEVIQKGPGNCPKCGMRLVPKGGPAAELDGGDAR